MENVHSGAYLFKYADFNLMINPQEYGITMKQPTAHDQISTKYKDLGSFYDDSMSPTKLKLCYDEGKDAHVAVKTIYKSLLFDDLQKKQAMIEFPIQCCLRHENLVEGYEYSENDDEYVGVLEYVNKPNYLKEKIDTELNEFKSETKMKNFMLDLFEGVNYQHKKGIIHADIKLENILAQKEEGIRLPGLKLCDFGLVQLLEPGTDSVQIEKSLGTHGYMAPEIKNEASITTAVDMWSLGIVLYKFCVAYKPTQIAGYTYGSGPIPFRPVDWKKRSKHLSALIRRMLEFDPKKRISAEEALSHPWFNSDDIVV